jgi:hypothetical protein
MGMQRNTPTAYRKHPKAYFDAAKNYQAAADRLMLAAEAGEPLPVSHPIYFLYAHAIELALKVCMLAHGFNPAKEHTLTKFYMSAETTISLAPTTRIGE